MYRTYEEDLVINPCSGCFDDEGGMCKSKGGCGRMDKKDTKMRCKVCGREFNLLKENKYIVREYMQFGFSMPRLAEAFDCPICGCQNVVNERKSRVSVIGEKNE